MFKGVSKVLEDMKDAFRPAKVQEKARFRTSVSTLTQGSSEVKLCEITPNIKQLPLEKRKDVAHPSSRVWHLNAFPRTQYLILPTYCFPRHIA